MLFLLVVNGLKQTSCEAARNGGGGVNRLWALAGGGGDVLVRSWRDVQDESRPVQFRRRVEPRRVERRHRERRRVGTSARRRDGRSSGEMRRPRRDGDGGDVVPGRPKDGDVFVGPNRRRVGRQPSYVVVVHILGVVIETTRRK